MISFNDSIPHSKKPNRILIGKFISVQAGAEATGYNIQYLRRLLRYGKLEASKSAKCWLIEDNWNL
jgi:hypothetical protein